MKLQIYKSIKFVKVTKIRQEIEIEECNQCPIILSRNSFRLDSRNDTMNDI